MPQRVRSRGDGGGAATVGSKVFIAPEVLTAPEALTAPVVFTACGTANNIDHRDGDAAEHAHPHSVGDAPRASNGGGVQRRAPTGFVISSTSAPAP